MTCIALIGNKDDMEIENLLELKLSPRYNILKVKENSITSIGSGYPVVLSSLPHLTCLSAEGSIVVLKKDYLPKDMKIDKNAIIVANAENVAQIALLKSLKQKVISCGSPKDTISFSSTAYDSTMITLNRKIISLSGREIEPLEFPVSFEGMDLYSFMALTATRLLLDDFNSSLGKLY